MLITLLYLYGAWNEKWEFNPYWLAAATICDVWLIHTFAEAAGCMLSPVFEFRLDGQ